MSDILYTHTRARVTV